MQTAGSCTADTVRHAVSSRVAVDTVSARCYRYSVVRAYPPALNKDTQRQGQDLTHSQVHYVTRASKFRCHYFNTCSVDS
jgi:hypothetical protein